jgi:two-component system, NtrC family, nitrogen regulation sensor histidine kinase NtrY
MATLTANAPVVHNRSAIRRWGSQLIDWLSQSHLIWVVELGCVIALALMAAVTAFVLIGQSPQAKPMSPTAAAALLVANLLPATTLLMLMGRRMALQRAPTGGGQLHIRLVAIFSLLAAVPALLLAIFASLLFQSGVQFWSSDSARSMLENSGALAKGYTEERLRELSDDTVAIAGDVKLALDRLSPQDPVFLQGYFNQVLFRKLSESAVFRVLPDGQQQTIALVSADETRERWVSAANLARLNAGEPMALSVTDDRIEAVLPLPDSKGAYFYASRAITVPSFTLGKKAQLVLDDYRSMIERSRNLQFQFNALLYIVSLVISGLAVWIALLVADRLVRPINSLVLTAQRISDGDLSARVTDEYIQNDEVGFLAQSFNHMTERLQSQTGNLLAANRQLDDRRTFIETILESVSAAVLSTNSDGSIRLANGIADQLLNQEPGALINVPLQQAAPFLSELIEQGRQQAIVQLGDGAEPQTLAVKITALENGHVVAFEDITQQLTDQRQAAWADVARRIAHEIKNPLTPIQLAAERLQRRFGKQIDDGAGIFAQLTGTIVRQVGDLRNIVDEFSSFARMPKPVFRDESLNDIVGHSVFLFEVAHTNIAFDYAPPDNPVMMRCDRRQVGQAVTNILKNAAEAIEARMDSGTAEPTGKIGVEIAANADEIRIIIRDNGIGLPDATERLVEPYVTTRSSGSGLGLAIVKKIVEEHHGELLFSPNDPYGAQVIMKLYPERLVIAPAHSAAPAPKSKKSKD